MLDREEGSRYNKDWILTYPTGWIGRWDLGIIRDTNVSYRLNRKKGSRYNQDWILMYPTDYIGEL